MYRNGKSLSVLFFVVTLLGMLLPSLASALGTPDGLPPPMEHICDAEKGAAYGLCNAFCQAMDCDSDTPSASENACQKVANKFMNITGRQVPCSEPSCPMFLREDFPIFNGLVSGEVSVNDCQILHWPQCGDGLIVTGAFGSSGVWYSNFLPNGPFCENSGGEDELPPSPLNDDQYSACKSMLEGVIPAIGDCLEITL